MQTTGYREGYFMSIEEEDAASGDILRKHSEASRRLVSLQAEADKLAEQLAEIAGLLRHGPPYSVLPLTGFLNAETTQRLFKDLHDTYEEKAVTGQRIKELE